MGPTAGAFLGFVFGCTSVIGATMTPGITSFVFSPFITVGGISGNFFSLVIALVPRILLGVIAGYVFKFAKKYAKEYSSRCRYCSSCSDSMPHNHGIRDDRYLIRSSIFILPDGKEFSPFYNYSRRNFVVIINPLTKEKIQIEASKSVKFKIAKALKEAVNK